jgi:hypothetical protein
MVGTDPAPDKETTDADSTTPEAGRVAGAGVLAWGSAAGDGLGGEPAGSDGSGDEVAHPPTNNNAQVALVSLMPCAMQAACLRLRKRC